MELEQPAGLVAIARTWPKAMQRASEWALANAGRWLIVMTREVQPGYPVCYLLVERAHAGDFRRLGYRPLLRVQSLLRAPHWRRRGRAARTVTPEDV